MIFLILVTVQTFAQIQINNFGAGLSYWHRLYSGIDERAFLINYPGTAGNGIGALMPTVCAEVGLIQELSLEGRAGLWASTFTGEGTSADGAVILEEMDQRIIPLSIGAVYTFRHIVADIFNASVGIGINRYYIRNTMERRVFNAAGSMAPQVFTGNNLGLYGKTGIEYMIVPHLGLALEGRYNTGSYNQTQVTQPAANSVPTKVSLKGIEVGLVLRYSLFPMYGRSYRRY